MVHVLCLSEVTGPSRVTDYVLTFNLHQNKSFLDLGLNFTLIAGNIKSSQNCM